MSRQVVNLDKLGSTLTGLLNEYKAETSAAIDEASERAIKKLVQKTKSTAPKESGYFARAIKWKLAVKRSYGNIYVWYVESPFYRLTHLIVHGHALPNGGRTQANPFLKEAMGQVLPEYEQEVREIFSGK